MKTVTLVLATVLCQSERTTGLQILLTTRNLVYTVKEEVNEIEEISLVNYED
jgi:hypothetical protein